MLLTKFETKSNKVKGIAFHGKRPWILASLYNGTIQLWDYKLGTLVNSFEEHEGPVRGLDFHKELPLFVSGGDDYKLKLWNYKTSRCQYTLMGHLDFIRTVQFHSVQSWIVSCGDDQTIRIWNWQSRACIAVLTGHSHYVMSAFFHPTNDLLVSASLDQTIRVWDIAGLRKKHAAGSSLPKQDHFSNFVADGQGGSNDLFGNIDCIVKYVLEGHSRGVNYANFHPTLPLVVSCGDDRLIKLWRMNDHKAWEVDTCRGHYNNCSAVVVNPRQDVIVSVSEDKSIRVWDLSKRVAVTTSKREQEKIWALTLHPTLNLYAAGHDGGLIVFKLERERPAFDLFNDYLFYIKEKNIRQFNLKNGDDQIIASFKRGHPGTIPLPKTLSFNPAENAIILSTGIDGTDHEIIQLKSKQSVTRPGSTAIYIARNRVAVVEGMTVSLRDLQGNTVQSIHPQSNQKAFKPQNLFYIGGKQLGIVGANIVIIYDLESNTNAADFNCSGIRFIKVENDLIAIVSKHNLYICNKKLEQLSMIHETVKIKSGCWVNGVFVYNTLSHFKYCLSNGDRGIIKSSEEVFYLVRVIGGTMHVLRRSGDVATIHFDASEYLFKMALLKGDNASIDRMIAESSLVGRAIISYLYQKGYAGLALQFVKEPSVRFELALESGRFDIAKSVADSDPNGGAEYWDRLGVESKKAGQVSILESVYQKQRAYEKLSFLYMCSGDREKGKKMAKIAKARGDLSSLLYNATLVGDLEGIEMTFEQTSSPQLQYLLARTFGVKHNILEKMGVSESQVVLPKNMGNMTRAPLVIARGGDWPQVGGSAVRSVPMKKEVSEHEMVLEELVADELQDGGWGDAAQVPDVDNGNDYRAPVSHEELGLDLEDNEGWGAGDDLELEEEVIQFEPPSHGSSPLKAYLDSKLAAVHIAVGSLESGMTLLQQQAGIVDFSPLKPFILRLRQGSCGYLETTCGMPAISVTLKNGETGLPISCFKLDTLITLLQDTYALMTAGKFADATVAFRNILLQSIFVLESDPAGQNELKELVKYCREYLIGLGCDQNRGSSNTHNRNLELASYFTHCELQSVHLSFALKAAMVQAFKMKNFGTALSLAQRLLALNPPETFVALAQKIINHGQKNPSNALELEYDPSKKFVLCAGSYVPIYDNEYLECGLCGAKYSEKFMGEVCAICKVAEIGAEVGGILRA